MATRTSKNKRHDWEAMRREYVEASSDAARPSLEKIAERHGCDAGYVRARAGREKWSQKASRFLAEIEQNRYKQVIQEHREAHQRIDIIAIEVCETLLSQIAAMLQEAGDRCFKPYEVSHLCTALKTAYEMSRQARGDLLESLMVLSREGMLSQNQVDQIAFALDSNASDLQQQLANILQSRCPD